MLLHGSGVQYCGKIPDSAPAGAGYRVRPSTSAAWPLVEIPGAKAYRIKELVMTSWASSTPMVREQAFVVGHDCAPVA